MPITFMDIQSKSDNAEVDSSHDEFRGKEEYYCLSQYTCFQLLTYMVTNMIYNIFNQHEMFKYFSLPHHLYYHCI